MKLIYLAKRFMEMDKKAMLKKVRSIHDKTGKSKIWLFGDMIRCSTKYGAGYMDYDLFEMYNLTPAQRDTYITRGRNNLLVKKYNDASYNHCFLNKSEFNTTFADFIKREWIKAGDAPKDEVMAFMERHPVFMAKPTDGKCGHGIEKVDTANFPSLDAAYEHVTRPGVEYELEELIVQHPDVSAIYPGSINTVRIVTILKDETAHIICAYFRIGNGKFVDNFNSGGMVAPVDEKTGIVKDRAIDKNKVLYETHPATGAKIKGFQFPFWQEALELCQKAAHVIPEMGYVGWDVCFTPDGPCFVEGNEYPGYDIYQLPEHTPDKIGMMEKFLV